MLLFLQFFYQRNVLMSIRDYIKNIKKPYWSQTFEQ